MSNAHHICGHTVVQLEELLGGGGHLEGDHAEALLLEALDDLADEAPLDAIRLDLWRRSGDAAMSAFHLNKCVLGVPICKSGAAAAKCLPVTRGKGKRNRLGRSTEGMKPRARIQYSRISQTLGRGVKIKIAGRMP